MFAYSILSCVLPCVCMTYKRSDFIFLGFGFARKLVPLVSFVAVMSLDGSWLTLADYTVLASFHWGYFVSILFQCVF